MSPFCSRTAIATVLILAPVASWAATGTAAQSSAQDDETYLPPAHLRALPKPPNNQQKANAAQPGVQRRQARIQPSRRYIYHQPRRRRHFEPFFFGLFD